jgi:hypothetical protein
MELQVVSKKILFLIDILLRCSPMGHWYKLSNQQSYFEAIGQQIGVKVMEGWYNISQCDFGQFPGASVILQKCVETFATRTLIVGRHNNSLSQALSKVYTSYEWVHWKFTYVLNIEVVSLRVRKLVVSKNT